ncbi:MAG: Ni/Fe-hydrogenase cytochrome b subunit [Acidobacteria bacterium]|nr:MAG: Ni/Fe-hydrogenase cytochrome b subunit [Acidobacteriota bacterium]
MTRRVQITKGILWFITGLAAAVTIIRFTRGLGTTTALSDTTPWGLWVGFDVMGGVALAAGGFVIGAIAHVFKRDKYHHAVRPAILTALLGYAAVAVGLLFDLGLPWNIWHALIFWNPQSPLFEVAWCVMIYLTILFLEFLPVFLERTRFQALYRILLRMQLPLIILGISVSTLHQSSLGTLLLIMPFRLHPLWYTPHLPELFFVSAICLGLSMVIFESSVTAWLYKRKPNTDMLSGLARFAAGALALYLAFRLFDLWHHDKIGLAFEGSFEARLFWFEMGLSTIVPLVLFLIPKVRRSHTGVFIASSMGLMGFLLYRIDASGLAQVWATRTDYFPMWTEFAVSFGIVSFFALIYLFIQEHFPVEHEILDEEEKWRQRQLFVLPRFDRLTQVWLGDPTFASRRVYSLVFVVALVLGLTSTPWQPLVEASPVQRARGGDILKVGFPIGTVAFPHAEHVKRLGKEACGTCHHLHLPGDVGTPCSECHSDLYLPTRLFDHYRHVGLLGGNPSCERCHPQEGPRVGTTAKKCSSCHEKDMMAENQVVKTFEYLTAPGLSQAAHGICIECHKREATNPEWGKPDLFRCATCHRTPVSHGDVVLEASLEEIEDEVLQ